MIVGRTESLLAGVNFEEEVPLLVATTLEVFDRDFRRPNRKLEDPTTDKLIFALLRHQASRENWFSDYTVNGQRNEYDSEGEKLKGRTDITFELGGLRRFTWECKLLHTNSGTLYSKYRTEGVMRFVTEKYGQGEKSGGMLAYVMDGETQRAIKGLESYLNKHKETLKMSSPCFLPCQTISDSRLRESHHAINDEFVLFHGFLNCN